jgi:GNAT superfamily N-acetyltransferase
MRIHYREYREEDLESLKHLMSELGYSLKSTELKRNIAEILQQGGAIFVGVKDRQVIGAVCVLIDARLAEGIYGEIVSLIVTEKLRGQGLGRQLVQSAEDWAGKRVNRIRVRANVIRKGAHQFYENLGFQAVKDQKVLIKHL